MNSRWKMEMYIFDCDIRNDYAGSKESKNPSEIGAAK